MEEKNNINWFAFACISLQHMIDLLSKLLDGTDFIYGYGGEGKKVAMGGPTGTTYISATAVAMAGC